jgi:hypothetical protein
MYAGFVWVPKCFQQKKNKQTKKNTVDDVRQKNATTKKQKNITFRIYIWFRKQNITLMNVNAYTPTSTLPTTS